MFEYVRTWSRRAAAAGFLLAGAFVGQQTSETLPLRNPVKVVPEDKHPVGSTLYDRLQIALQEPENQAVFCEAQRLHNETGFETGGRILEVNGRLIARIIPNEFDRGRHLLVDYLGGNRQVSAELTNQINQAVYCGLYNLDYVDMGNHDVNGPIVQFRRPGPYFMHQFPHPFPFARRVQLLPMTPLSREEFPALCSLFFNLNTRVYRPEKDVLMRALTEGKLVAGFHIHPTYHLNGQASEMDRENSYALPEIIRAEQDSVARLFYLDGGVERELGELR